MPLLFNLLVDGYSNVSMIKPNNLNKNHRKPNEEIPKLGNNLNEKRELNINKEIRIIKQLMTILKQETSQGRKIDQ